MEKRKKPGAVHAVFFGNGQVQEVAGQSQYTKRLDAGEGGTAEALAEKWEDLHAQVEQLKRDLSRMQKQWSQLEWRWREAEREQARERERLVRMVLLLKQEWEAGKHEDRHH